MTWTFCLFCRAQCVFLSFNKQSLHYSSIHIWGGHSPVLCKAAAAQENYVAWEFTDQCRRKGKISVWPSDNDSQIGRLLHNFMNASVMSTPSGVCHPWQIVAVLKAPQQEECIPQLKKKISRVVVGLQRLFDTPPSEEIPQAELKTFLSRCRFNETQRAL